LKFLLNIPSKSIIIPEKKSNKKKENISNKSYEKIRQNTDKSPGKEPPGMYIY
jgi:hypothetical protein